MTRRTIMCNNLLFYFDDVQLDVQYFSYIITFDKVFLYNIPSSNHRLKCRLGKLWRKVSLANSIKTAIMVSRIRLLAKILLIYNIYAMSI